MAKKQVQVPIEKTALMERVFNRNVILYILVTFLVVGGTTVVHYKKSISHAFVLATTHQPEKVTELYFTNYGSITKNIQPNTSYSIPFTVVNHEASKRDYSYVVLISKYGSTQSISSGVIKLADEQSITKLVTYSVDQSETAYQIIIKLTDKNQEIKVGVES